MERQMELEKQALAVTKEFQITGSAKSAAGYGSGHINDTFLVKAEKPYILQRMNRSIFIHPEEVMEKYSGSHFFFERKDRKGGRRQQPGDSERNFVKGWKKFLS